MDLDSLDAAFNEKTRAIVVNNPSNPCGRYLKNTTSFFLIYSISGTVYTAEHLQKIIDVCEKRCVPIIADEIYADMVS